MVQYLQNLFAGTGYNCYDKKNLARADDLLVRQKASGNLAEAGQRVAALDQAYCLTFIPPATHDSPFPPAAAMAKAKDIRRLHQRLSDTEVSIRSMPVPTQDKIWWRYREEKSTLDNLLYFDFELIRLTSEVLDQATALTAQSWNDTGMPAPMEAALSSLDSTIRDRRQLLAFPG